MSPSHCFVALALLAFRVSAAAGQTVDPRTDAPLQLGPFYITPVLELSQLGVDTNVFNTSGEQQSDFTVIGGPRVDVAIPLRRFVFTADTVTDLVYYQRFENQRGVNFDMTLRGEAQLPKLTFFVEDFFLNTRQRPNFEIDVRARRKENVLRGGLSVDISRRMALEVAANRSLRKYAGDDLAGARLARVLNRDSLGASGSMRFLVSPLTSIRLT